MKKLLLKPELFTATIELYKTETRRVGGLDFVNENPSDWSCYQVEKDPEVVDLDSDEDDADPKKLKGTYAMFEHLQHGNMYVNCRARYQTGEVVFLAEPVWLHKDYKRAPDITQVPFFYDRDVSDDLKANSKSPLRQAYERGNPMFMREFHARHFIKIKGVGCERLQDITEEAAIREGVRAFNNIFTGIHRDCFAVLIDKINKPGTWASNKYVFVYQYEYLKNYKRSDDKR